MSAWRCLTCLIAGTSKRDVAQSLPRTLLRQAGRRSYSGAASAQSSKKFDLASPKNDYISLHFGADGGLGDVPSSDLEVYPDFMNQHEQEVLLSAALKKLDSMAGREERKRRRDWYKAHKSEQSQSEIRGFLPDEVYEFEQRHFDGVISDYRESTLSEWTPFEKSDLNQALASTLGRAYALMHPESDLAHETPLHTPPHLLSHLLHLSSTGYILPHVDNVQASAGTILGLCLGSERDLVLTSTKAGHEGDQIRVRLPPGCAYVQRGQIRYTWKHEIPAADPRNSAQSGQRLSVMIRDRLK